MALAVGQLEERFAPVWEPQPGPQSLAVAAPFVTELMYGGARGGGKSDFLLGDFLQDVWQGEKWRGIVFRQSYPQLEELITRAKEIYLPVGATWKASEKTFIFPSGATLKMRHLENEQDCTNYQGHQYTWIGWDELTNWANLNAYKKIRACLRSAHGALNMRIRCSANPGGVGHHEVKAYFVDFAPKGMEIEKFVDTVDMPDGSKRIIVRTKMFIPSRVYDNIKLLEANPEYISDLRQLGTPELVRAWLEGDWSVITGAYFPEMQISKHVIEPFAIPEHWLRFRAGDWGSASPFAFLWFAVSDGYTTKEGQYIPSGALVVYREFYGMMPGKINVGLRWPASRVGAKIKEMEAGEKVSYGVIDPSAYKEDGGPSHAERMGAAGVFFRKADNNRIGGWDMCRERLCGEDGDPEVMNGVGTPMVFMFKTATHLIRTLPALQHDLNNPEDCDTKGEDHAPDAFRYGCMSRPWKRPKAKVVAPRNINGPTLDELWKDHEDGLGHFRQL